VSRECRLDLTVRTYELDQYGVVNNAVYQNYLELARAELLAQVGVDTAAVARGGRALALSELLLKFRRPLVSGDAFQVRTHIAELTGVRAVFAQQVLRMPDETVMLDARAEAVFLDERGRPMRIAPEIKAALSEFLPQP